MTTELEELEGQIERLRQSQQQQAKEKLERQDVVEKQKADWAEHEKAQAREDEAKRLLVTDPKKGQALLAAIRAEEAEEKAAEEKARVRVKMAHQWVQAGGDLGAFTDKVFDELYTQLTKEKVLRAMLIDRTSPKNRPLRF